MVSDRTTVIDRIYWGANDISDHLRTESSLSVVAEEIFGKYLLLASASYFEERVKTILLDYVEESSGGNERLVELVRNKVTDRGYYTLFEWERSNANRFWGLFGKSFRAKMSARVEGDASLNNSVRAFLKLTQDRNDLIHGNIGSSPIEKTSAEIYDAYKIALEFVDALPQLLRESED